MVSAWAFAPLVLALVHFGQCSPIVPPLYRYDDYTKCRQDDQIGAYCFVKVVFQEDRDPFVSSNVANKILKLLIMLPSKIKNKTGHTKDCGRISAQFARLGNMRGGL